MKRIPLIGKREKRKFALIDDKDFAVVSLFRWFVAKTKSSFYAATQVSIHGKVYRFPMHRLILNSPSKNYIDHINHDGLDNRTENLRICTPSQNGMNRRSNKNTSSKYKGVCWNKADKQWRAYIRINGKLISLGSFDIEIEAARKYNESAREHFKEFAYLNDV